MQVTENLTDGLKRELGIVIPATDLGSRLDRYLEDLKGKVQIRGFRPGKVPVSHLKKVYGKSAMGEILNEVVGESMTKVMEDRNERPAMQPELDFEDGAVESVIEEGADLAFKMSYEVLPDITLGDFSDVKLERLIVEVSDEEVEERLTQIAESSRPFAPREDGDAAADGDRVTMAYVGKIDGEPFEGGSDENGQLVLGSGQFIPGFEDQLVGAKVGESRTIEVKFPDDYPADHLAGKDAEFEVEVKEIAAPGEIELNDEFATQLGIESMDRLRQTVRDQVQSEYGQMTRQRIKRLLLDQLEELHQFELPPGLVDTEFEAIWKQVTDEMERAGKSFEDGKKSEEEMRDDYHKIAGRRVRLGLVLAAIGEEAKIEVTDEEMQRGIYEQMRQFPGQEKAVYEHYQKSPEALASIRAPIFEEKVVDYVLELADVTDKTVSRDDLIAALEEDDEDEDAAAGESTT